MGQSNSGAKIKRGPPSKFNDELGDEICRRLSEGESLRSICSDEGMPSRATVINWEEANPEFYTKCARARERQADWVFEDIAAVEQDVLTSQITPEQGRVVIGSKQWRAGRLNAKRYSDKVQIEANVTMSWASIVEDTATKRLENAKVIEGEIIEPSLSESKKGLFD